MTDENASNPNGLPRVRAFTTAHDAPALRPELESPVAFGGGVDPNFRETMARRRREKVRLEEALRDAAVAGDADAFEAARVQLVALDARFAARFGAVEAVGLSRPVIRDRRNLIILGHVLGRIGRAEATWLLMDAHQGFAALAVGLSYIDGPIPAEVLQARARSEARLAAASAKRARRWAKLKRLAQEQAC